jgi:hypothetical protein
LLGYFTPPDRLLRSVDVELSPSTCVRSCVVLRDSVTVSSDLDEGYSWRALEAYATVRTVRGLSPLAWRQPPHGP